MDWSLSAAYTFTQRDFDIARLVTSPDGALIEDETPRQDELHSVRASLAFRGYGLATLRYLFDQNESNSFGRGLQRHGAELNWTFSPIWRVLISLRARVQRTVFDDPVRVDEFLQIDDEGRNQLQIDVSVPLPAAPEGVRLELGYAVYTQAFDGGQDFVRHLGFLGLSVNLQ